MWARLYATDGAALKQRVEAMVRAVCDQDPRTLAERRADAMSALAAGQELACGCGRGDCTATSQPAPTTAVVHVVADAATVTAATAAAPTTECSAPAAPPAPAAARRAPEVSAPTPTASPTGTTAVSVAADHTAECSAPPAFVMGGGIMPAPLLSATLERATVREIRHPGDAPPEPNYVPSRALAEFVRCRDLTCRWPGCDKPAYDCDLDHTIPYPVGATHASNMKCYCRFHRVHKRLRQAKSVSPKPTATETRRRRAATRRERP